MSHSSGLRVSDRLRETFKSSDFQVLFLQLQPVEEEIFLTHSIAAGESPRLDTDFPKIHEYLSANNHNNEPHFVIYKLDSNEYLLISFVPDSSQVRLKMLYSSSKSTLTKQLGDSLFSDQLYCNQLSDLTLESYQKHLESKNSKNQPLTEREIEKNAIRKKEMNLDIGISTKKSFNNGIQLDFSSAETSNSGLDLLKSQLASLDGSNSLGGDREFKYFVFNIDRDERFVVHSCFSMDDMVSSALPDDEPRFTLFRYVSSADSSASKIMFVYYCPGTSRVRDRMIYSASRQGLLTSIDVLSKSAPKLESKGLSSVVDVKCELSEKKDLTREWLELECGFNAPRPTATKNGFIKKGVSRPAGGPRKLINKTEKA